MQDILNDMGIKVMGDVISILKHAKQVHSQVGAKFIYLFFFVLQWHYQMYNLHG